MQFVHCGQGRVALHSHGGGSSAFVVIAVEAMRLVDGAMSNHRGLASFDGKVEAARDQS
jgi:hypothetical protein